MAKETNSSDGPGSEEDGVKDLTQKKSESDTEKFILDNLDEDGNLPPLLDTVVGHVETKGDRKIRDSYFGDTGESKAVTYKPWVKGAVSLEKFTGREPQGDADKKEKGFTDIIEGGLKRTANRYIDTWNELTNSSIEKYDTPSSMEDAEWENLVDDLAPYFVGLPLAAKAGALAGTPGGPVGSAIGAGVAGLAALAVNAYTYTRGSIRKKPGRINDQDVFELLGANVIPDSKEEIDAMTNQELWLRIYASEVAMGGLSSALLKGGGKVLRKIKGGVNIAENQIGSIGRLSKDTKSTTVPSDTLVKSIGPLSPDRLALTKAPSRSGKALGLLRQARLNQGLQDLAKYHEAKETLLKEKVSKLTETYAESAPNPVGMVTDSLGETGKALDRLGRSRGDKGIESALDDFTKNAADLLKTDRGTTRIHGEAREKALKEESGKSFWERFSQGSEYTGEGYRGLLDAQNKLYKKYFEFMTKNPGHPLADKFELAIEMNGYRMQRHATRAGGELQAVNAYKQLVEPMAEQFDRMKVDLLRGNHSGAKKNLEILDKFSEKVKTLKPNSSLDQLSLMTATIMRDNLVGNAALKTAWLSNKAITATEIGTYSLTGIRNPLPYIYKGVYRATKHAVGRAVGKDGYLRSKRPWGELLGGSTYEEGGRTYREWRPTTKTGRGIKALSTLNMSMLRELDGFDRELMSALAESQAMEIMERRLRREGKSWEEIWKIVGDAASKQEAPTDFLLAYHKQVDDITNSMLMRGQMAPDAPYIARLGWSIDSFGKTLSKHGDFPARVLADHTALFTRTAANVIDRGIRYSPLGLARPGALTRGQAFDMNFRRAVTGTIIGWGAYHGAFRDAFKMRMGPLRRSENIEYKRFGGQEGIEIGGKIYEFKELGPLGVVVHGMAKGLEASKYLTRDDELDFQATANEMANLAKIVAQDTWLAQSVSDFYHMLASEGVDLEEGAKRSASKYSPGAAFSERIVTAMRGYSVSDEGVMAAQRLLGTVEEFYATPRRDAFGTVVTLGEEEEGITRNLHEQSDMALFFNKAKKGKRSKSNELLAFMANSGIFDKANEMRFNIGPDGNLRNRWPRLIDKVRTIDTRTFPREFTPRLVKIPPTLRWMDGTYKLKYADKMVFRGLVSMDVDFAQQTLDEWKEYYESSPNHQTRESSMLRRQSLSGIRRMKAFLGKNAYANIYRGYVPSWTEQTRLVDVMHSIATSDMKSAPSRLKGDLLTLSSGIKGAMRAHKFADQLGLEGKSLDAFALRVARNHLLAKVYSDVVKLNQEIMGLSPTMDEYKREYYSTERFNRGNQ